MKRRRLLSRRLPAATLPELLVVIIVSGILFLSLFEGMSMVTRFSGLLRERLTDKGELLRAHSVLEGLTENLDSICRVEAGMRTLLLYRDGEPRCTLTVDSAGCVVSFAHQLDTLFGRRARIALFPDDGESRHIDSIVVTVPVDADTLSLTYAPV
ncbi:MAG: hypothetical protein LBN29_03350 [Mediterranea sp.]|jgi:hypothetical protein|nr:hypothetical protein [Mediterranea sp.]